MSEYSEAEDEESGYGDQYGEGTSEKSGGDAYESVSGKSGASGKSVYSGKSAYSGKTGTSGMGSASGKSSGRSSSGKSTVSEPSPKPVPVQAPPSPLLAPPAPQAAPPPPQVAPPPPAQPPPPPAVQAGQKPPATYQPKPTVRVGEDEGPLDCCCIMWSVIWLGVLVFFAWPFSVAMSAIYGFVSPLISLLGIEDISDFLLDGVHVGKLCARNVRNGVPML